jgi:hypothetical protein
MCTKLPNWGSEYSLRIGDVGYVTLQTFIAGETFYDRTTDQNSTIKFTNVYFKEFIKDNKTEQIVL